MTCSRAIDFTLKLLLQTLIYFLKFQSMNRLPQHLTAHQVNLLVTTELVFPTTGGVMENMTVWITQMRHDLRIAVSLSKINVGGPSSRSS